ncbi:MAG: hypothetical protein ACT4PE_03875 [Candidatus Eiseniibacteriota bacterium]
MKRALLLGVAAVLVFALGASAQVSINEIRTDDLGTDNDEYFELKGTAGASLAGYHYIVLGDGTGGSGVIEQVTSLAAFSLQADGLFAYHDDDSSTTGQCGGYDAVNQALNFENSDNVTHMLVFGFTGANGQDLDTNDDGTLDVTPWSQLVDSVALFVSATSELTYSPNVVGPDGAFAPGHIYFCAGSGWIIGQFTPECVVDTPGAANSSCPVSVDESTWGQIKAGYHK